MTLLHNEASFLPNLFFRCLFMDMIVNRFTLLMPSTRIFYPSLVVDCIIHRSTNYEYSHEPVLAFASEGRKGILIDKNNQGTTSVDSVKTVTSK
jgi:hypothetical protein